MEKQFALPNMEYKFSIQVIGEESGLNWTGDFVYRRPNLKQRGMIEVMMRRLCGDLRTLSADVESFNEALAHLRFTLIESPDWWQSADFGGNLFDGNVIIEIYNKCIEFEADWKSKVHGGKQGNVSASASGGEEKAPVASPAVGNA